MPSHIRVSGTWKKIKKVYVRQSGVWKEVKKAYVRVGGVWKLVHVGEIPITISSNQVNLNLFTYVGSPGTANDYVVTINSGVYVYSNSTGTPAMTISGFPAGSKVTIINNGHIVGMGGAGGNGGGTHGYGGAPGDTYNGQPGGAGGHAISTTMPLTIDNTSGNVWGGGGGGGGGASYYSEAAKFAAGGGGGGGASGLTNSGFGAGASYPSFWNVSQPGTAGSISGAGTGGAGTSAYEGTLGTVGGNGGSWGVAGSSGGASSAYGVGSGGAAGKAINTNGNAITWLGGNNGTQVRGLVS